LHSYTKAVARTGRRQQVLIVMKGRVEILSYQNLTLLTYHWSSAGMFVAKMISVKESSGRLQTSKAKDFVTREPTFS